MEKSPKKSQVKNLLNEISPEDLEKIKTYQSSTKGAFPVDNEWLILAEWLKIAGYQAYLDAKNDAVDSEGNLILTMAEILTLIEATRKLNYVAQYRNAESSFIGAVSAQAKRPSSRFKSLTKKIINNTKVHE